MWDFFTALLGEHYLWLMFLSGFLSATVLPGNSEMVFTGFLLAEKIQFNINPLALLSVAIVGNSLGSFSTYAIGRWLPKTDFSQSNSPKVRWIFHQFQRYGELTLLLSWLPVIGDLLCAIAGWLQLNGWRSLVWITVGKGLRYGLLYLLIV